MPETSTAWNRLSTRVLSVARIREIDRVAVERYRMHSLVLMENAALNCVHWLNDRFPCGEAVVLCGRGNNGGDGLAIARHLRVLGWACRVVVLGPIEKMSVDARANLEILLAGGAHELLMWDVTQDAAMQAAFESQLQTWLSSATLVIDAMLGTGATGEPRAPLNKWIQLANQTAAQRVAIDVPSGWDASSGAVSEAVFKADATLTFVARKPAMASIDAAKFLGEIVVLPIGIPQELIEELLAANL